MSTSVASCAPPSSHTLRLSLGVAVAAGVPALVLASVGPVAAIAGPASIAVWTASALLGVLMAIPFARLARAFPGDRGGVAVLAANVLRPRSRFLARLAQWSYWLGWTPAMAIGAALVAEYAGAWLFPGRSPWLSWALATSILCLAAFVNRCGIRSCAWMQLILVVAIAIPIGAGAALALAGHFRVDRLTPFAPPSGWASWQGGTAICGALFLAGWSAYGAEIALTYAPEYRRGTRDAVRSLFVLGAVVVTVYSLVPLLLVGALDPAALSVDTPGGISSAAGGGAPGLAAGALLVVTLLLTVNMIAASDSRVLCQMSRNGDAWACLGRVDRRGTPRNALLLDVAANSGFIAIAVVVNHGNVSAVPVTLLTAASVGYFVSLILALVAAALLRPAGSRRRVGLALVLAAANVLVLAGAAASLGWTKISIGGAALLVPVALLHRARRRALGTA